MKTLLSLTSALIFSLFANGCGDLSRAAEVISARKSGDEKQSQKKKTACEVKADQLIGESNRLVERDDSGRTLDQKLIKPASTTLRELQNRHNKILEDSERDYGRYIVRGYTFSVTNEQSTYQIISDLEEIMTKNQKLLEIAEADDVSNSSIVERLVEQNNKFQMQFEYEFRTEPCPVRKGEIEAARSALANNIDTLKEEKKQWEENRLIRKALITERFNTLIQLYKNHYKELSGLDYPAKTNE